MSFVRLEPIGRILLTLGIAVGLAGIVHAQSAPKLVAPVYTGATTLDCKNDDNGTKCIFLTKDSLDKVKAFYDKSVGGLHQAKNGYVMVLRSGKATEGEGTYYTVFATAEIHGLPAAKMPPASDPKAQQAAGQLKYLQVMSGGIGWPQGGRRFTPDELKASGLRPPEEFTKVFQQYRHLESSYYPEDKVTEAKKSYDAKRQAISQKYEQAGAAAGARTQSSFEQMRKDQARQQQDMQRKAEEDCKRGPTAQQKADHEELKRILRKNSAERYNRFIAATAKMEKYQKERGCAPPRMTRDDPAMQNAMEVGQILQEDKEAMAFLEKVNKRDEASRPKNTGAEAFQKNIQGNQQLLPQQMNEQWQAGLEYLAALDKIAYRTRIAISGEKFGADKGQAIVTDRPKVEAQWAQRKVKSDNEDEDDSVVGSSGSGGSDRSAAGKSASAPAPASGAATPGAQPGQAAKAPEQKDDTTEGLKKAGSEGFKMIKKLF